MQSTAFFFSPEQMTEEVVFQCAPLLFSEVPFLLVCAQDARARAVRSFPFFFPLVLGGDAAHSSSFPRPFPLSANKYGVHWEPLFFFAGKYDILSSSSFFLFQSFLCRVALESNTFTTDGVSSFSPFFFSFSLSWEGPNDSASEFFFFLA